MFDAIVVGGSYAGISAALPLARARRRVLVVDAGRRRNRFASESHNFLSRDGEDPAAIAAIARQQLLAYPTAAWREAEVTAAGGSYDAFSVGDAAGFTAEGRRLLLALGVTDELPQVAGLAERWGRHVFHCPYCHGYEIEGQIGVLGVEPRSIHQALMLPDWGPTTYLLNGMPLPQGADLDHLRARGVTLEPEPIRELAGDADVVLDSGRVLQFGGLFTASRTHPASPIPRMLGCAMEEGPAGMHVRVNGLQETSVPGVFACGDVARPSGSVALAVGDGSMAGVAVHRSLMFPEH